MYFLSKVLSSKYRVTDTADWVSEDINYSEVLSYINMGIDIKGIYKMPDGELFCVALKITDFTDRSKMGAIITIKNTPAIVIKYHNQYDLEAALITGGVIRRTAMGDMPSNCSRIEAEVRRFQQAVVNMKGAKQSGRTAFTFSETAGILGVSPKSLFEYYKRGEIKSFRYGVYNGYFQITSEQMFTYENVYDCQYDYYVSPKKLWEATGYIYTGKGEPEISL